MVGTGVVEVLEQFGSDKKTQVRRYKEFIRAGWEQGRRPELVGGGLIRSLGGWEAVKKIRWKGLDRVACDARILGGGEFVEKAVRDSGEELSRREQYRRRGIDLDELADRFARLQGVDFTELCGGSKVRRISEARALFVWLAVMELGYTGIEVARKLKITTAAVSLSLDRVRGKSKEEITKIINKIMA